jgi:hypothetical protein
MRRSARTAPRAAAAATAVLVAAALASALLGRADHAPIGSPVTAGDDRPASRPQAPAVAELAPAAPPASVAPAAAPPGIANGPLVVIGTQGDRNGESPIGWYALSMLDDGPCDGGCLEPIARCPDDDLWCGTVTGFDFSRDGRLLAVAVTSLGRDDPTNGIHVIDLQTGRDREVRNCDPSAECLWVDLAWSPDATRLAYAVVSPAPAESRFRNGLGIVAADGTSVTDVLHTKGARSPTWSASGDRLAFESAQAGGGIDLIAPDGRRRTRLVDGGHLPAWSPDGSTIAYGCGRALALVRPDGTDATPRPARACRDFGRPGRPVWSPDGTRLAIVTGEGVDVMRADGSDLRSRTRHVSRSHLAGEDVAWRPIVRE